MSYGFQSGRTPPLNVATRLEINILNRQELTVNVLLFSDDTSVGLGTLLPSLWAALFAQVSICLSDMSRVMRKPVFRVSDQV